MNVNVEGQTYHVERSGSGSPVVVLHGFTGSIEAMRETIDALALRHTVVAIDLPGHGTSDHTVPAGVGAMERVARDLPRAVAAAGVERAAWLGYSLGGRTALTVADVVPEAVTALVLVGASAGIADATQRAERVRTDDDLADAIERDGVATFVERWERLPLFAGLATLPPARRAAILAQRLRNTPHGLAGSLRGMGTGRQRPLHDRLHAIDVPTLLVAGSNDTKFLQVANDLAPFFRDAHVAPIAGAGHAAHIEKPAAFVATVERFFALESRTTMRTL